VLVIVAAVIAVGAFLVLRPDDEDSGDTSERTTQPADTTTATTPQQTTTEQTTPEAAPKEPEIQTIRVKGSEPVGGLTEISAKQGETVEFAVRSDAEHEIHVHGYDVSKDVGAGETVRFQIKATETGIFEIELEDTGTQIAELKVEP
jgi:plastocyanin